MSLRTLAPAIGSPLDEARWVDVDSSTLTLDPDALRRAIVPEIEAVWTGSVFGRPCPQEILSIAQDHGLRCVGQPPEPAGPGRIEALRLMRRLLNDLPGLSPFPGISGEDGQFVAVRVTGTALCEVVERLRNAAPDLPLEIARARGDARRCPAAHLVACQLIALPVAAEPQEAERLVDLLDRCL